MNNQQQTYTGLLILNNSTYLNNNKQTANIIYQIRIFFALVLMHF